MAAGTMAYTFMNVPNVDAESILCTEIKVQRLSL